MTSSFEEHHQETLDETIPDIMTAATSRADTSCSFILLTIGLILGNRVSKHTAAQPNLAIPIAA